MWFAPRCGVGLNDSLGRRCPAPAPNPCSPTPTGTLQQLGAAGPCPGATKRDLQLARTKSLTRIYPKPTRQVESCGESRLSEAEVQRTLTPMPLTARAMCQQQRMSDELYADEVADPAVRETRPNT